MAIYQQLLIDADGNLPMASYWLHTDMYLQMAVFLYLQIYQWLLIDTAGILPTASYWLQTERY